MNENEYLEYLCEKGAAKLQLDIGQEPYASRYKYELKVIEQNGFANYLHIVSDIISFARDANIFIGPGRGSSAGSLLCYLLGITMVDPLKYDLLFERFLNPARAAMGQLPDIDLDFQASRREEILEYIGKKYGKDCTAQIPTLSRFGVKSGLRDLARIESIPISEVDRVTKKIPDKIFVEDAMYIPEVDAFCHKYPRIRRLLPEIVGSIRHRGIHAAGVVITPGPISDYISLEKVTQNICSCFDKDIVEEMGLLKFDILGLKTLDVIHDTINFIKEQQNINVVLPTEFDDPKVYELFQKGDLHGVFQFETQNLTEIAKQVKIDEFRLIYDTTSIARPGTAHSGDMDIYIKQRHAKDQPTYVNNTLESIVDSTYGVLVYQEQLMQICHEIGNFSLSDAEKIRKLVSKSKGVTELDKYRKKFIAGAKTNGFTEEAAEGLWSSIREAGAYSFNKSHAVAYSMLSYWCTWLKVYYPKEFLAALMRHEQEEMLSQTVVELRDHGFEVKTPDINMSEEKTTIDKNGIVIFGLSDVENVGPQAVKDIIENRPYKSLDDFMNRRTAQKTNIRVVRNLILGGAFDAFGRRDEFYYMYTPDEQKHTWDDNEMWLKQMGVLDMPPLTPMMDLYKNPFNVQIVAINDIDWTDIQDEIFVNGVISSIKIKPGYGHMNLNDGSGIINVLMSEEQLEHYAKVLEKGAGTPVMIKAHMVLERKRLYSDMIIPFEDYDDFQREVDYIEGKTYNELNDRKQYAKDKIALVISSNYFTSKRGNKGTRITLDTGDRVMCFERTKQPIMAGDIIEYRMSEGPFIKILSSSR